MVFSCVMMTVFRENEMKILIFFSKIKYQREREMKADKVSIDETKVEAMKGTKR